MVPLLHPLGGSLRRLGQREGTIARDEGADRETPGRVTAHPPPSRAQARLAVQGTDSLGYRIFPARRLLRKGNAARFRKRLERLQVAYSLGEVFLGKIDQSVESWIGCVKHSGTYRLRVIFADVVF